MPASQHAVSISNEELVSVRDAMRELGRLLERLNGGEVEKLILTQKNQMRAVLLTIEQYSQLQSAADGWRAAPESGSRHGPRRRQADAA